MGMILTDDKSIGHFLIYGFTNLKYFLMSKNMRTIALYLPNDKNHRLKTLADQRIKINQLFNEMAILLLPDFGTGTRFRIEAQRLRGNFN